MIHLYIITLFHSYMCTMNHEYTLEITPNADNRLLKPHPTCLIVVLTL